MVLSREVAPSDSWLVYPYGSITFFGLWALEGEIEPCQSLNSLCSAKCAWQTAGIQRMRVEWSNATKKGTLHSVERNQVYHLVQGQFYRKPCLFPRVKWHTLVPWLLTTVSHYLELERMSSGSSNSSISRSVVFDSCNPMGCSLPGSSLSMEFSWQEYWSG